METKWAVVRRGWKCWTQRARDLDAGDTLVSEHVSLEVAQERQQLLQRELDAEREIKRGVRNE